MGESRRKFIRNTTLAGAAVSLASNILAKPYQKRVDSNGKLKVGIIGSGLRGQDHICLLYTSDAADERYSVDLGGRRLIKKKI